MRYAKSERLVVRRVGTKTKATEDNLVGRDNLPSTEDKADKDDGTQEEAVTTDNKDRIGGYSAATQSRQDADGSVAATRRQPTN